MPLGVEISGANTHDIKLLEATLDSIPLKRPKPTRRKKQHLCLDKGYDSEKVRRTLRRRHYTPHIKHRGEEAHDLKTKPGYRAPRWGRRAHALLDQPLPPVLGRRILAHS